MLRRVEQTAQLHAALRDYDGDLGFWAPFGTYIPEGLAELQAHARPTRRRPILNGRNGNGPCSRRC